RSPAASGAWDNDGTNESGSSVKRPFARFVGVDLGGGRGKTTAIAELRSGPSGAEVVEVATRGSGAPTSELPWTDATLMSRLGEPDPARVIAIDAPLTVPSCMRCEAPVCPGMEACSVPAVAWLRTQGRALISEVAAETVGGGGRGR